MLKLLRSNPRQCVDNIVERLSKHLHNIRFVRIQRLAGINHKRRLHACDLVKSINVRDRDVQHLLVVTDPTHRGIVAAERIAGFRKELDIHIDNCYLILNDMNGAVPAPLQDRINQLDIPLLGVVPHDETAKEFEFSARPLVELSDDSPLYQAVAGMLKKILSDTD